MANNVITQRQDPNGGGSYEGLTFGEAIRLKLYELMWLQPGITYTWHNSPETGQDQIPVFEPGVLKGASPLCGTIELNKALQKFIPLVIDKAIGGSFGGCFRTSDLTPADWEKFLNDSTFMQMAQSFMKTINDQVTAEAVASTVDPTGLTAFDYFNLSRAEHFEKTTLFPTFALINVNFHAQLIKERVGLGTAGSDFAWINGSEGNIVSTNLFLANIDAPFIMMTKDAVHIKTPQKTNQIQSTILDTTINPSGVDLGISGGLVSNQIVTSGKIANTTEVFMPFGSIVIPELTTKGVPTV